MHAIAIDDDKLVRDLLKRILERRGYRVSLYERADLCCDYYCELLGGCADIIISDLEMPDCDGLMLAEELAQKGCKVHNRALMSGAWNDEKIERAKALGWRMFFKPFDIKEFYGWLQECEGSLSGKEHGN